MWPCKLQRFCVIMQPTTCRLDQRHRLGTSSFNNIRHRHGRAINSNVTTAVATHSARTRTRTRTAIAAAASQNHTASHIVSHADWLTDSFLLEGDATATRPQGDGSPRRLHQCSYKTCVYLRSCIVGKVTGSVKADVTLKSLAVGLAYLSLVLQLNTVFSSSRGHTG